MDYLLLLLTVLFWSGNFVMGRWIYPEIPPVALAFWRWALALVILLPFTLREVYRQRDVIRQNLKMLALLALLSVTNFNIFLYVALNTSPVANAALINSMIPIFIVILSWVGFRRGISLVQVIGIVLSLSGLVFIVLKGDLAALHAVRFLRGDLWALSAALSWAIYTVLLRHYSVALSPVSFLTVIIIIGVVFIFPVYLGELAAGARANFTPAAVGGICYLALFPSILSYLFWNRGIRTVGATRTGVFIHLLPVFSIILAMIFLGEPLKMFHVIGACLIFSGIYLTTRKSGNH
ncbi:MAG: DMT family transporter [Deltaproteobacteria bacterium]|nr:DMT family transporter [Deltaproteobacteria bacterium]